MARQLISFIKLTDDLDGTEGDETSIQEVELGIDGNLYVLDLTQDNAEALRGLLAPYMDAAHDRLKMPRAARTAKASKSAIDVPRYSRANVARDRDARKQIRQWADTNGYEIRGRGFIRSDAVVAYRKANPNAYIPPSTLNSSEEISHA